MSIGTKNLIYSCLHHQKQHITTPEQNTLSSVTTALHMYSLEIAGLLVCIVWTLLILPLLSPRRVQAAIKQDNHGNNFTALAWHHHETPIYCFFVQNFVRSRQSRQHIQSKLERWCLIFGLCRFMRYFTLSNERGLISKITWKLGTYPKVAKKLVWNPFPGNRHEDSMHAFLLQEGCAYASARKFTSYLNRWIECFYF